MKKKRSSDGMVDRHTKRFRKSKQRPVYHMEQESWDEDDPDEQQEDDLEEDQEPGAAWCSKRLGLGFPGF